MNAALKDSSWSASDRDPGTLQALVRSAAILRAQYEAEGFFVVRDIWEPDQLERLKDAAARVSKRREGALAPVMNPHTEEDVLFEALRHPVIVAIMQELVGGPIHGLQSQLFFCPPGTPGFCAHQDNFYVQARSEVFASAWTALEDARPGNGGLIVYPGTHRLPILPVEDNPEQALSASQDPNANSRRAVAPEGFSEESIEVPAGAVAFLHGHLVHRSHDNDDPSRWRRSLLKTYIRQGEPFRAGRSAARSASPLYGDASS